MHKTRHSLAFKVTAIFLLLTVVSVGVLNVTAYIGSSGIFQSEKLQAMKGVLTFRGDMLRDQLAQMEGQAVSIARIESLQMAITSFRSGWKTIEKNSGNAGKELIDVFITKNTNADRAALVKPEGPSGFYYSTHEKAQPEVAGYLKGSAFSDLMIADMDGNIIYSYRKSDVFARNVASGELASTALGNAFRRAADNAAKAGEDQAPAGFSGLTAEATGKEPGIFFGVPVLKMGAPKGVILFQVRNDLIAAILAKGIDPQSSERSAIVGTGGSAIGLDGQGRLTGIKAPAVATASEAMTVTDFTRADGAARSYARSVGYGGETMLVVESILLSELEAGSLQLAGLLVVSGLIGLALLSLVVSVFSNRMFAPLARLAGLTETVAAGKLDVEIGAQSRKDEIGTLARALESFRRSLTEQRQLEAAGIENRERAEAERLQRLAEREAEARQLQDVVAELDKGLGNLAGGNLVYRIDGQFPAALEPLRVNFNHAIETLRQTLSAIGGNSLAVHRDSEEMRGGADQLAQRTERQAASITETVTAIGTISQAVRSQIERGSQAEKIAAAARADTLHSGKIMTDTISAMEAIQSSSRQINQIIDVIDDIAFQTNLLALNAGVEAARAGESGKGFAVVAQEVRELAQRSSAAAQQISELLKKSTAEVETGVSLVEKAGSALKNIGDQVEAIDARIREIMASTRDEAETLRAVNGVVSELDGMTRQNAAMVQDTTSAIHRLASEAGEMDRQLGQFVLAEERWRMAG
ncbi:methyl-accepting chemotaxis protein [Rhizobium sp. YJ-22]|uniref:methyl-accepting chemotaxis protein n=1 Tax=Rhizobium sp. YJ-22 TaxID=3037556 RepID=UPI0024129D39|nr:methyl-accepting chemotaxis protein [Rhizobium sp. YJ-22]MDG3576326.1 methyl-accepting chemotaxis protein [Rhizobium sp. YJ-22]